MARAITITDPRTIKLIEREASRLGLSLAETVERVFSEPSSGQSGMTHAYHTPIPPETPEERATRLAEADRILSELQAMVTDEDRNFDYNAWLYDENGLPH